MRLWALALILVFLSFFHPPGLYVGTVCRTVLKYDIVPVITDSVGAACFHMCLTRLQLLEYSMGLTTLSWYSILHTMMTHTQTVDRQEAMGLKRP